MQKNTIMKIFTQRFASIVLLMVIQECYQACHKKSPEAVMIASGLVISGLF